MSTFWQDRPVSGKPDANQFGGTAVLTLLLVLMLGVLGHFFGPHATAWAALIACFLASMWAIGFFLAQAYSDASCILFFAGFLGLVSSGCFVMADMKANTPPAIAMLLFAAALIFQGILNAHSEFPPPPAAG